MFGSGVGSGVGSGWTRGIAADILIGAGAGVLVGSSAGSDGLLRTARDRSGVPRSNPSARAVGAASGEPSNRNADGVGPDEPFPPSRPEPFPPRTVPAVRVDTGVGEGASGSGDFGNGCPVTRS